MEYSWPAECVIKLIQWKYGSLIPLQELQRIQRIEYDPGGSLGRFCRTLTRYSNAVVFFALSFAIVNASGHYVNHGVIPSTTTNNGSDLYSPLGTSSDASTVAALTDQDLMTLDLTLQRVSVLPLTSKVSVLSMYGDLVTSSSTTTFVSTPSSTTISSISTTSASSDHHISGNFNESASVASNDSSADFGIDVIASTITSIFLSINDSQVPRFSNRTPHLNVTETEGVGYFGVLSVVLGLMILLTIVGKLFAFFTSFIM
ncbi:hypothetical protein V9T40_009590 [Parthenolecanium corni]|uniref:Uncharacterized protein n=1 Tax=Parthenolecanium corni TaxID=536013 RepID=A0AAN9Y8B6_9HEMI